MNYQLKRSHFKNSLDVLEVFIRGIFNFNPKFIELKHSNDLIRMVWDKVGDYKAESILRVARRIRAEGTDTEENQSERANSEVAYREHFKNQFKETETAFKKLFNEDL